jgi:hypothetical protein
VLDPGGHAAGRTREDNIRLDPTKLTIDVSDGPISARQNPASALRALLDTGRETTHNTLSVLVTLGTTQSKVLRLINALRQLAAEGSAGNAKRSACAVLPPGREMALRPRDAYFRASACSSAHDDEHGINRALARRRQRRSGGALSAGDSRAGAGAAHQRDVLRFLLDLHHADTGIELHGVARRDGRLLLRILDEPVSSTPTTR